ncbi:hypothetical protein RRG08_059480 [Elysia crispata]|uniref:Uncharacterized protein n=1 Tax=Elysia crispata TaxID=231223 RepID=A0AAE1A5W6_9GAST|nr:hypothetical protein RRG08_059480 [Elysia crispata]
MILKMKKKFSAEKRNTWIQFCLYQETGCAVMVGPVSTSDCVCDRHSSTSGLPARFPTFGMEQLDTISKPSHT